MKSSLKLIPLAALLAFGAAGVSAQTPAPMTAASTPTKVGVTPQDAAEATQKAVPRKDTATLVKTSPSAEEKAKAAMSNDTPMTTAKTTTPSKAMKTKRAARADRN